MRYASEWGRRQAWRLRPTQHDVKFRGSAVARVQVRPVIGSHLLDDWQLQTIAMCPSGGQLDVYLDSDALGPYIRMSVRHPTLVVGQNEVFLRLDANGLPFVYFDMIRFSGPPGFGTTAFTRSAQTAARLGYRRVELLAAGGPTYKMGGGQWAQPFNGHYTWARFGFNAALHPQTLANLAATGGPANCQTLLDVMDQDPTWWKQHGAGGEQVFDLDAGSRSWHTLFKYLKWK